MDARQGSAEPFLSLIIPAYDESAGIRAMLEEADAALGRLGLTYEIVVVDDGSRDGTEEVVSAFRVGCPRVRLVRHPKNRGYGAALRTGFEAARGARVAFTDADCQFHLEDLGLLVAAAERAPIAVGFRVGRKDPWRRRFISWGYNRLVRALLGTGVRDCDCALKVFRRSVLDELLPESDGFFVNTEILARARRQGLEVVEVGVRHRPRRLGESKVSLRDIPRTLAELLPFWWSRVLFAGHGSLPPCGGGLGWGGKAPPPPTPALPHKGRGVILGGLALMLAAFCLFFARLDCPLLEPDEARYAEIPRQMLAAGNFITPVLHGEAYYQKPPLLYWLVMASYQVFGVHDWAARIVPAAASLLTVLITFWWAWRTIGPRAALVGGLVLCLTPRFIYHGRMLTPDPLLTLWTVAAWACAHVALHGSRRWWLLSAVACALGVLTKGPVALLLVAIPLVTLTILDRRFVWPGINAWLGYVAIVLAMAGPWYAAMMFASPQAAGDFVWLHHVRRFFAPIDHQEPAWFYLPGLVLGTLPWSLLLLPMARWLCGRSGVNANERPPALGFFLLAGLWPILFFSLCGCKRPAYVLPALPPLALALGTFLATRIRVASATRLGDWWPLPLRWTAAAGVFFLLLLGGVQTLLPEYNGKFGLRAQIEPLHPDAADADTPVVSFPRRWDSVSFYLKRGDVRAFGSEDEAALLKHLHKQPRTLLVVKSSDRSLEKLLKALPKSLEFVPRTDSSGKIVAGIVQPRAVQK